MLYIVHTAQFENSFPCFTIIFGQRYIGLLACLFLYISVRSFVIC